jgi:hypothetical protein
MIENDGYLHCVSCIKGTIGLAHSHNMPVGQFVKLESDPENFKLRCLGCHQSLDYPDFEAISKFADICQIMTYRAKMDIHAHNRFVSGFLAVGITDFQYIEE